MQKKSTPLYILFPMLIFFWIGCCVAFQCDQFKHAAEVRWCKITNAHFFVQCNAVSEQLSDTDCVCVWEPANPTPQTSSRLPSKEEDLFLFKH